jgi:hypothetical protein
MVSHDFGLEALKRGLLQRLEDVPLRFAFDRLKGGGWTSMFRQSGLREQRRDMARSTESARQPLNDPGFRGECVGDKTSAYLVLSATYNRLNAHITAPLDHLDGSADSKGDDERSSRGQPAGKCANESHFMHVIEEDYQNFSTNLLRYLLIPYWWKPGIDWWKAGQRERMYMGPYVPSWTKKRRPTQYPQMIGKRVGPMRLKSSLLFVT